MTDALVPRQSDAAPAAYDPATLAVLAAMEEAAEKHLDAIRPHNTKRGYANDWKLWEEFHQWLAERTGHPLALTDVTKGTLVGFVVWLDTIKLAAPTSIDRRITGVTVTARREHGVEVPKEATVAARQALKPLKADEDRIARGRGQAAAATPQQLQQMSAAVPEGLTGLRDRALWLMAFGIAGRSAEVAALRVDGITLHSKGLKIRVPGVKGRPAREVVVMYGKNPDTCPVRAWSTWKAAGGITAGAAFRAIDVWGNIGDRHLSAEAVREIIARNAERAGIAVRLTGHSMRAGFITTSRVAGKREEKIRAQSGHAENSPAFWGYIREADKWTDAASEDIGL
ncbi:tyrosine-type recombinase/integrase [Streptomyces sp. H27-D2]|uniref:tyrosine-type recombinase/integrase n=1 Tax=Streptomyces sp. H27-D2 TaxID=3046304 RepID=UPI002DBED5D5|nr:tyrosine-type recombinase/integrase [Streptomyces sp. H27-D2]MEC4016129.1 tyrosine-type recombinase/integrase [Streptomyces sp. H27-D2]